MNPREVIEFGKDPRGVMHVSAHSPVSGHNLDFYTLTTQKAATEEGDEQTKLRLQSELRELSEEKSMSMTRMVPTYNLETPPEVSNYGNTLVEVNIPFCLHLPNGLDVMVKTSKGDAHIFFYKIWTTRSAGSSYADFYVKDRMTFFREGSIESPTLPHRPDEGWDFQYSAKNCEKTSDDTGYFRYTKMQIFFNTIDDRVEDRIEQIEPEIQQYILNTVNDFLDVYRVNTLQPHIGRLAFVNVTNIFFLAHNIGIYPVPLRIESAVMNRSGDEIERIVKMAESNIKPRTETLLLMDAERSLLQKDFVLAVVVTSQALEIFLAQLLQVILLKKGFTPEKISTELSHNRNWQTKVRLDEVMKSATGKSLKDDNALWCDWTRLSKSIRDEVIHKGKTPTELEAKQWLEVNKRVVIWLQAIESSST